MKICNACGKELPDDAIFCASCGERLLRQCSICGTELKQDYVFCPKCGNAVTEKSMHKSINNDLNINTIPTQPQTSNIQDDSSYDNKPHPWIRLWARSLDISIFNVLLIFVLGYYVISCNNRLNLNKYTVIIIAFLIQLSSFILEAWFLSIFQTTPGKKLLKIKIIPKNQKRISFKIALSRSIEVFTRGLWLGFFPLSLIPLGINHDKLQKNKITDWDKRLNLDVKHAKISFLRLSFCIILFSIIVTFQKIFIKGLLLANILNIY